MRIDDQRRSENIEDRRGQRGRVSGGGRGGGVGLSAGRFGIGGLIIIGLLMLFFPQARPLLAGLLGMSGGAGPAPVAQQGEVGAPTDAAGDTVAAQLGSIEDVWTKIFAEGGMAAYGIQGQAYQPPTLVLFDGAVASACGQASSASGPFYCPADSQVYLDTSFFAELKNRFGAPGDFAQAYVIAHEVGHHIQNLTGVAAEVNRLRGRVNQTEFNRYMVMMELQADCFAGVWGRYAAEWKDQLEPGDIEEALNAANAIGDDRLQKQARGYAVPDSFTHGTSEQRMRWFKVGFDTGEPARCDTFNAREL